MTKRYGFLVTSNKTKDMQARLKRMKRHAHDDLLPGDDSSLTIHKKSSTINVTLVGATWSQVIVTAFIYALFINTIKHFLYIYYGHPTFEFSDERLEAEYQELEKRYRPKAWWPELPKQ